MKHRATDGFRGQDDALHYDNGQNWLNSYRQTKSGVPNFGTPFYFAYEFDFYTNEDILGAKIPHMEKIHKNILIVDHDDEFKERMIFNLTAALQKEAFVYMKHAYNIDEAESHLNDTEHTRSYNLIIIDGLVIDTDEKLSQLSRTEEELRELSDVEKVSYSYARFISTIQKTQKKNIPILLMAQHIESLGLPGTTRSFIRGYGRGMFPGHKNEHAQLIRDLVLK